MVEQTYTTSRQGKLRFRRLAKYFEINHLKNFVFPSLISIVLFFGSIELALPGMLVCFGLFLFGYLGAFRALVMIWLISFFNYGSNYTNQISFSGSEELLKWVALAVAAAFTLIRVITNRNPNKSKQSPNHQFALFLPWVIFTALATPFISYVPELSLMKLTTFTLGTYVALEMPRNCKNNAERCEMHSVFAGFLVVLIFGSIMSLASSKSYVVNGLGFQGILNQPQALGILLAVSAFYLFGVNKLAPDIGNKKIYQAAALASVVLLPLTLSRTSLLAFGSGVFMYVAYSVLRGRVERLAFALAGGLICLCLILVGADGGMLSRLIYKKGSTATLSLGEELDTSRGDFINKSLQNFSNSPMTGIGFGLPSIPSEVVMKVDPYFGLPIGAPTEKGMAFVALLEETGSIGFGLMMSALLFMIVTRLRLALVMPLQVLISTIVTNFGEATFFSLGGLGFLFWLIIGVTAANRNQQRDGFRPGAPPHNGK